LEEWKVKRISPKLKAIIEKNLKAEIDAWESWCNGECYGYIIKNDQNETLDPCWGFYGLKDVEETAEEQAEFYDNEIKQGLTMIENRLDEVTA